MIIILRQKEQLTQYQYICVIKYAYMSVVHIIVRVSPLDVCAHVMYTNQFLIDNC